MTLPLLEPFSDSFVRQACLLSPNLLDVESHIREQYSGDLVRFSFAISASRDIAVDMQGVWEEAAAAWSHVSDCTKK